MRDADREIGVGPWWPGAPRDDDPEVTRHRRIGELLLRADEIEETLDALRCEPGALPLRPGESREETLRALEWRARMERGKAEALDRMESLDYAAVERALRLSAGRS